MIAMSFEFFKTTDCGVMHTLNGVSEPGDTYTRLILGLRPANERRGYFVTTSLISWVQA